MTRRSLVSGLLGVLLVATGGLLTAGTVRADQGSTGTGGGTKSATEAAAEPDTAPRATGTPLMDGVSLYPRAVRLAHSGDANGRIIASVVTFNDQGGVGAIFESTDEGATFQRIGSIPATAQAGTDGLCCASIFELPSQVGDMPAGTLLWAGSVGADADDRRMTQRVWRSDDHGQTWSYLSNCAEAPDTRGMWEPEFSVDASGRLVCHFADETESTDGGQQLARTVSSDGVTWEPKQATVLSQAGLHRPGMPVVRRLPDGGYAMVYEICGSPGQYDCAVYWRTSADGADWGDPADPGQRIASETGRYFTHTPTISLVPKDDGGARVLLVGQLLSEPDGQPAAGNGSTLMVNEDSGNGPWREIAAPVEVPDAFNNYCPNYSSTLVPIDNGQNVLEIATDYDDADVCRAYFASGPLG